MNGWDPERDTLCLHDDRDLGVALVVKAKADYVQPVCENCERFWGTAPPYKPWLP